MKRTRFATRMMGALASLSVVALGGCGGGGGGGTGGALITSSVSPGTSAYTQQVAVSGLPAYSRVVLLDNGGNPFTVQSDGNFAFPSNWSGGSYALTVQSRSPGLSCALSNASGALGASDVTATVQCGPASETTLYSFGPTISHDGYGPLGSVIQDATGDLLGTTQTGGATGNGMVYKIGAGGAETVLWSFPTGGPSQPYSGLVADSSGNLYGTTKIGGALGSGTLFKIAPDGTQSVVYSFGSPSSANVPSNSNGAFPLGNLIRSPSGMLYGTTSAGGAYGAGTVFSFDPASGSESVLYSFGAPPDGALPWGRLLMDASGNLYGTTRGGGTYGLGTVFKVSSTGAGTVLHSFGPSGSGDGDSPLGGLVADAAGNLYGTTQSGGAHSEGTVFEVTPAGVETVLYSFASLVGAADGGVPDAGLVMDADGNLYGTTVSGGPQHTSGVVFRLDPSGALHVIYNFGSQPNDGVSPMGRLLIDSSGDIFGTDNAGGSSNTGTVFEIH